jgi:DNA-binding transcriptional MocR family regulator
VAAPAPIDALSRLKLLTGLTTPTFAERIVNEMLVGGQYRKHVARIRDKLAARRTRMAHELERAGWMLDSMPEAGLFLWARHPDVDDSLWFAQGARRLGVALAPGASFRPSLARSPWMRFAGSAVVTPADYRVLARAPQIAADAKRATKRAPV